MVRDLGVLELCPPNPILLGCERDGEGLLHVTIQDFVLCFKLIVGVSHISIDGQLTVKMYTHVRKKRCDQLSMMNFSLEAGIEVEVITQEESVEIFTHEFSDGSLGCKLFNYNAIKFLEVNTS